MNQLNTYTVLKVNIDPLYVIQINKSEYLSDDPDIQKTNAKYLLKSEDRA